MARCWGCCADLANTSVDKHEHSCPGFAVVLNDDYFVPIHLKFNLHCQIVSELLCYFLHDLREIAKE